MKLVLGALALGVWVAAFGQSPVISSFSQNGVLVCTNLAAGSLATVEWASSVTGPWTNTWAGLDSVLVDSNGMIQVSVPMFYRVRGTSAATNVLDIEASVATLTVAEGGTETFGVRLTAQPSATTTVNLSSDDLSAATVAPASLIFTTANWDTLQTVTVTGVADVDLVNESVSITLSSAGLTNRTVTATVTDDDTQGIVISTTSLTVGEGGTGNFTVRLAFQPSGNVTVSVNSSDPLAATVSPPSLTFTPVNYATPQTVTVSGVNDVDLANESATITASSPGVTSGTVGVTVMDDDTQSIVVSTTSLTVGEAGTGNFTVRLAFQPTGNVTVSVGSSDTTAATVAPTSLTFTPANFATPQTVTVSGVNDVDTVNESVTATVSSAGLTSRMVDVTVIDND